MLGTTFSSRCQIPRACCSSREPLALASPYCERTRIECLDEPPDWWSQTGSNRRPPACKAGALPAELWPRKSVNLITCLQPKLRSLVGLGRLELPTSRLSSARSNQLSYKPVIRSSIRGRTSRIVALSDRHFGARTRQIQRGARP
jgi:hypothetical protein